MASGGGASSPFDSQIPPYDYEEDLDFDFASVDDDSDDYDDSDSEMNDNADADPYGDSALDAPARGEDGEEHQGQPEEPAVDGGDQMDTGEGGAAEGADPGGPVNPSAATGYADLPAEPNCPVCFEPWTPDGPHRVCCIPCGHVYGRSCLERWVERSGNNTCKCPLCNKMFNKQKGIINLFAPVIKNQNDELEKEVLDLREQNEFLRHVVEVELERRDREFEARIDAKIKAKVDAVMIDERIKAKVNAVMIEMDREREAKFKAQMDTMRDMLKKMEEMQSKIKRERDIRQSEG